VAIPAAEGIREVVVIPVAEGIREVVVIPVAEGVREAVFISVAAAMLSEAVGGVRLKSTWRARTSALCTTISVSRITISASCITTSARPTTILHTLPDPAVAIP
jgi:hypothetical protein